MRADSSSGEPPIALSTGRVLTTPSATADGAAVRLPGVGRFAGASLPRSHIRLGPVAGRAAIAALIAATFAVVLVAASGPSVLVPRSAMIYPSWDAGPLHLLLPRLIKDPQTMGILFSIVLTVMVLAYLVALGAVRSLSMKLIVSSVLVLHLILFLSPPLQLNDVFNYIGYARLGGLHHLNPYTHVIKNEFFDPVYRFSSWHNLKSPYGPLFTALTYPLAFASLPVAYWTLKAVTVLLSLAFIALVWHCARQLGRDPRYALVFVALNPIYLIYAVAGFHNDFFMLVPSMGAIALLLARRDRAAGAALTIAIAIKFTAVLLLPFLLVAAHTRQRRLRVAAGAGLAAVPLIALTLALFGVSIPNLSDQSSLLTDFSFPNVFGLLIGIGGGAPGLLKVATVLVVVVVAYEIYRRRDWLIGAGWSTFALIASLAWLVPWYVIWLLPLAALATSSKLRTAAIALTVYLILAFMPAVGLFMSAHGIRPLGSSVGQASISRQHKLAN